MSVSAATLLLPAPDASWRVWKPRSASPGDAVENPADLTDAARPLIIGLPATACRTLGMVLPQSESDVMEQMIIAQLEKRGLRAVSEFGNHFRWHQLGATGPVAIVSVDVLADPFPDHLALPHASDYTAALRLAQLPPGHLVVVAEQSELVLAANYQGKLFHSHIFAQQGADESEIAAEVNLARLSLEAQQGFGTITGLTLVGAWDRALTASLGAAIGLPVEIVPQLPPNRQETREWTTLLPAAVRQAQAAQTKRKKLIRLSALVVVLYAALAVLAFVYLRFQEQKLGGLSEAVEATTPAASAIRKTAERWKALAPALEPSRYLLVQLNDITSLMPPSGIVIRKFEAKTDAIEIRGEARDAQLAFQFLEDIKKHRTLSRYEWTMPRPEVKKAASFRIQGKLIP